MRQLGLSCNELLSKRSVLSTSVTDAGRVQRKICISGGASCRHPSVSLDSRGIDPQELRGIKTATPLP